MAKQGPGPKPARRTPLQALLYWTAVLGVWGAIFVVAFLAVFATDLPDTSTLYDVERQPSISYLDQSGALVAVRGSQYAPPVDLDKLPPYVPTVLPATSNSSPPAHHVCRVCRATTAMRTHKPITSWSKWRANCWAKTGWLTTSPKPTPGELNASFSDSAGIQVWRATRAPTSIFRFRDFFPCLPHLHRLSLSVLPL